MKNEKTVKIKTKQTCYQMKCERKAIFKQNKLSCILNDFIIANRGVDCE